MLFNSIDFAIFLPIVFALYWFVFNRTISGQNFFILISSYIFYGWWDVRFLLLIAFSTVLDYLVAKKIDKSSNDSYRKKLLYVSITLNLGLLGFFKYYNFFIASMVEWWSMFGISITMSQLAIILPVGISFYTFQTMSYTFDVYAKKIKASPSFVAFASYVSFFPQLVAGPIERAKDLCPQFERTKSFDHNLAVLGCQQILWGLLKKLVLADNCAVLADQYFNHHTAHQGSSLLLGAFFFTFQIYGDFSGYSDIAIGVARLFGFNLSINFNYPYFSSNITDFWKRWHISLTSWFRDYVYIPLGGNKHGHLFWIRNVIVVFALSGLWHGASWNFVVWGLLNALFFLIHYWWKKYFIQKSGLNDLLENIPYFKALNIVFTFLIVVLLWIFFRSTSLSMALEIIAKIFSKSLFTLPDFIDKRTFFTCFIIIIAFTSFEWYKRHALFPLAQFYASKPLLLRWFAYIFLIVILGLWMNTKGSPFIYFQF